MYNHADFEVAHTLAQYYPKVEIADICFIDDGISIPGSLEKKEDFIFKDDCDAIIQAINGESSDILDEGHRGYGLNTTINLVTQGNNGHVLIASRKGLVHIHKDRKEYDHIKDNYIQGTLISIRAHKKKVENIHNYVSNLKKI